MISNFPKFDKLNIDHKAALEEYSKKIHPYSDFNFTSIWSYNVEDDILVSNLNDNLVVRFRDYIDNSHFFSLLGNNKIIESIKTLMSYAKDAGITQELKLIPESMIESNPDICEYFNVKEDIDNHDYILSVEQINGLKGRAFHKKAAMVRQFKRMYPGYMSKFMDLNSPETHSHIVELFYLWEKQKNKKREDTEHELKALDRLLQSKDHLDLNTVGIYHNNNLISFIISEVVHENYAIIHFMKTDPDYKGVSEITHNVHAEHLFRRGIDHINLEQDLGIEGLRKAKQQWNPTHLLKKYTIAPK
jgi:hypothetical protein